MTPQKKKAATADRLEALRHLDPGNLDDAGREHIREALRSPEYRAVARAATLVRESETLRPHPETETSSRFTAELLDAFARFAREPARADPGCTAKLALLEALDFTHHPDPKPFLQASRMTQFEPVWRGTVDTAAGVRARAVLALANLGYDDILLVAATLLCDPEVGVRRAAVDAITHCGARAGAALLIMTAERTAEDPQVHLAAITGLLALAPDHGLPRLREMLDGPSLALAADVLGQSGRADALDALLEFVEHSAIARERAIAIQAIGPPRSDRAVEALLNLIAHGRATDAVAALQALATRRFDPRLRQRVLDATKTRSDAAVHQAFAEVFKAEGDD